MSIYKFSSQFTDFVKARSKNPDKIIYQVTDAIDSLKEMNLPLPAEDQLAAFHEDDISDEEMLELLVGSPTIKEKELKGMYQVLGHLAGSGKVDKVTRRVIEKFLSGDWESNIDAIISGGDGGGEPPPPEDITSIAPGVVRRVRPKQEEVFIETREPAPSRWEREEERMISDIDWKNRKNVASLVCEKLALAGVLETVTSFEPAQLFDDIKKRADRMQIRRLRWAKLLG